MSLSPILRRHIRRRQVLSTVDRRPSPVDQSASSFVHSTNARWRLGVTQRVALSVGVSQDFNCCFSHVIVMLLFLATVCACRTAGTAHGSVWPRVDGRAAGLRWASGPSCWCVARRCASSVSRWWWAAAKPARARCTAGAPGTAWRAARRAGRPSPCRDVAASGSWRPRMRRAAVQQTTLTASYSSETHRSKAGGY